MRRRLLVSILVLLIPTPCLFLTSAAWAQQAGKLYRVGLLLQYPINPETQRIWDGYVQRLREHGFVEGRNLVFERRAADGDRTRYPSLAGDLVRLKVDVIVTSSGAATRAAKEATSEIPIVMAMNADPVRDGLVASLGRPGGNVTGLAEWSEDLIPKRLALLKEAAPGAVRVAWLQSWGMSTPKDPSLGEAPARALGITLLRHWLERPDQVTGVLSLVAQERPDALFPGGNPVVWARRKEIANFAVQHRLPTIFAFREGALAGGLMSYGGNLPEGWRRVADYVARILAGTKPADLPVEQPTKLELVINQGTAKAIGLTIPPALLLRADEIIDQ